ncbi:MAG: PIN domain-containing protein [Betaproteobacteria bacterium]|nr:PIN domain-containing protein [Betaproteobacteria bacterium]
MARALVDTGAVVALVNRADRRHAAAVEWFRRFRGQLLTTEAAITETAYVLAASPAHLRAALLWFERARAAGLLLVEPVSDYAALSRIIAQYASLPCDYADASLIALAERTGVTVIATVDQRDFSVYRLRGRRRFRVVLGN